MAGARLITVILALTFVPFVSFVFNLFPKEKTMSSTLTALIAKLQAQLLDNGTLFTTPTATVAFREALRKFNIAAPIHAATLIDVVQGQKEYALNDPTIKPCLKSKAFG